MIRFGEAFDREIVVSGTYFQDDLSKKHGKVRVLKARGHSELRLLRVHKKKSSGGGARDGGQNEGHHTGPGDGMSAGLGVSGGRRARGGHVLPHPRRRGQTHVDLRIRRPRSDGDHRSAFPLVFVCTDGRTDAERSTPNCTATSPRATSIISRTRPGGASPSASRPRPTCAST